MPRQSNDLCDCRLIHRPVVEEAMASALPPDEVETLAQTFKALADETRLKILWALEKREMCVCDLAAMLGLTESAVSHQLRLLRNLQLASNRRKTVSATAENKALQRAHQQLPVQREARRALVRSAKPSLSQKTAVAPFNTVKIRRSSSNRGARSSSMTVCMPVSSF